MKQKAISTLRETFFVTSFVGKKINKGNFCLRHVLIVRPSRIIKPQYFTKSKLLFSLESKIKCSKVYNFFIYACNGIFTLHQLHMPSVYFQTSFAFL